MGSKPRGPPLRSARHERFCQDYLKDLNGTQTATRAGYRPKSAIYQASRLLASRKVAARVTDLMAERKARLEMDADCVVMPLREVADRCLQSAPARALKAAAKSQPAWQRASARAAMRVLPPRD